MNLGTSQPYFIGIGDTALERAHEYVLDFTVIAKQLQQRLPARPMLADAKKIFRCGVQVFDQKALIDDDNGRVQVLEHRVASRRVAALPGFPAWGFAAG